MSRYYGQNISWSTIGLVLCIAISLLFPLGINMATAIKKDYDLPIYISQDISVSGFIDYTIQGELKNRTNEDVIIEELQIALSGAEGNTHYYAYETIVDIIVPAGSTYRINLTDKRYSETDGSMAIGKLKYANIRKCIINGESVQLKKLDGDYYVNEGANSSGYIFSIIIGGLAIICAVLIVIYKIKHR